MVAIVPAPAMSQGADEDLLLELGAVVFPGLVERVPDQNGLRLRVDGNFEEESVRAIAADQFQILLGMLRAWNHIAGERADEREPGIGAGSIRDEHGAQLVMVGTVIAYRASSDEVFTYAQAARAALHNSHSLRNALWLHGRRDQNAADFYMIYEYARTDLGGRKQMASILGVTANDLARLTASANNLAPVAGGRHANGSATPAWGLKEQRQFVSRLLTGWISYRAKPRSSGER